MSEGLDREMKILTMDTSNQTLSIALLDNQEVLASYTSKTNKNHSVTLMPAIEFLMEQNNVKPADLERIIVAKGPGSYTGLRIGVTTAKTLAWTLGIELFAVSSLANLASTVMKENTIIVPIFDARRGNVYTGIYQWQSGQLQAVQEDRHIEFVSLLQELLAEYSATSEMIFVGEISLEFEEQMKELFSNRPYQIKNNQLIDSANLGAIAYEDSQVINLEDFIPTYLKLVEAEENWLATNPELRDSYVEKF